MYNVQGYTYSLPPYTTIYMYRVPATSAYQLYTGPMSAMSAAESRPIHGGMVQPQCTCAHNLDPSARPASALRTSHHHATRQAAEAHQIADGDAPHGVTAHGSGHRGHAPGGQA